MLVGDIVETASEGVGLEKPPLLVLDRVRAFLDEHGLGSGELHARRIGEGGGSNFTFLLERHEGTFVLRRPPRPPLPPSAHDVVREARLQLALRESGCRDVGRVDLDERVDEVISEATPRLLAFEPRRQIVRRHVTLQVLHDVERDAEEALVVPDRDDRRQARESGFP